MRVALKTAKAKVLGDGRSVMILGTNVIDAKREWIE